ncbi:MAG: hypothetical protein RL380_1671, partial [Verrucomicrobiota bacterium]
IGVLERPELPHSSTNKFIARYAYIALPVGKTLDLNFIHNYASRYDLNMTAGTDDGFLRNQGVGSWEINLGSFLTDLNTNAWPTAGGIGYSYTNSGLGMLARGLPFDHALDFLRFRYNYSYANLASVAGAYNNAATTIFKTDGVDEYADGPFQFAATNLNESPLASQDNTSLPWSGADNTNRFFTHQDFLDTAKGMGNFAARLAAAGAQTNSYDRYTYYRLLAELGTDSQADSRMNLNYDNLTPTNGVASVTNRLAWEPIVFFTNAANRLLTAYSNQAFALHQITNYPNSVTRIQLYPTNVYTPSVHRLLQLAANFYDATTNRFTFTDTVAPGNTNIAPPSVFRPQFTNVSDVIYISGYAELTNAAQIANTFYRDLELALDRTAILSDGTSNMVYGVPCILGAKKFLPNFNEFAFQTVVRATRKLVFTRALPLTTSPLSTNQMLILGVSNALGAEFWNSYALKYPRDVVINITNELTSELTNDSLGYFSAPGLFPGNITSNLQVMGLTTNILAATTNIWAAYDDDSPTYSFKIPFATNTTFLKDFIYLEKTAPAKFVRNVPAQADTNYFAVPSTNWNLRVKNRFRAVVSDRLTGRILDYVNFSGMDHVIGVSKELIGNVTLVGQASVDGQFWQTNRLGGSTAATVMHVGGMNQILTSLDVFGHQVSDAVWKDYAGVDDKRYGIEEFQYELGLPVTNPTGRSLSRHTTFNAPFQPSRAIYIRESWQANDPLVHYTLGDLTDLKRTNEISVLRPPYATLPPLTSNLLSVVNTRYQPWARANGDGDTVVNLAFKDPRVRSSSDWEFPTNQLPNLGWLGRVHRGTPWQSVYFKSTSPDTNLWKNWTGNSRDIDSTITWPTNDYLISSLFTTVPNDNAGRGRLNVNQPNLASWSAVLSGVLVLSNDMDDSTLDGLAQNAPRSFTSLVVDPAGAAGGNSVLGQIVASINATRTNSPFTTPADVFAAPKLTVASPFLNTTNAVQRERGLTDEVYERIPQQILGLLRGGESPRFVIYAYGQSLKPADRSIIGSGLCTNYQITAETALRAVVSVTNEAGTFRTVLESYNPLPPD